MLNSNLSRSCSLSTQISAHAHASFGLRPTSRAQFRLKLPSAPELPEEERFKGVVEKVGEREAMWAGAHASRYLEQLDPDIQAGLSTLAPGYARRHMPLLVAESKNGLIAFDDSWTALSWSQWLSSHVQSESRPVVVLHADDHRDLTSPLIIRTEEGVWIDALTAREIDFAQPETVASAIRSGCIGIGNFIAPLLYLVPNLQIRHLRWWNAADEVLRLQATFVPKEMHDAALLWLQLQSDDSVCDTSCGASFFGTQDVQRWADGISREADVLLHVDLDCFDDTFAGGKQDWPHRSSSSFKETQDRVRRMVRALQASDVLQQIQNVSVALSPGFCPSRYWNPLLALLLDELEKVGLRLSSNSSGL